MIPLSRRAKNTFPKGLGQYLLKSTLGSFVFAVVFSLSSNYLFEKLTGTLISARLKDTILVADLFHYSQSFFAVFISFFAFSMLIVLLLFFSISSYNRNLLKGLAIIGSVVVPGMFIINVLLLRLDSIEKEQVGNYSWLPSTGFALLGVSILIGICALCIYLIFKDYKSGSTRLTKFLVLSSILAIYLFTEFQISKRHISKLTPFKDQKNEIIFTFYNVPNEIIGSIKNDPKLLVDSPHELELNEVVSFQSDPKSILWSYFTEGPMSTYLLEKKIGQNLINNFKILVESRLKSHFSHVKILVLDPFSEISLLLPSKLTDESCIPTEMSYRQTSISLMKDIVVLSLIPTTFQKFFQTQDSCKRISQSAPDYFQSQFLNFLNKETHSESLPSPFLFWSHLTLPAEAKLAETLNSLKWLMTRPSVILNSALGSNSFSLTAILHPAEGSKNGIFLRIPSSPKPKSSSIHAHKVHIGSQILAAIAESKVSFLPKTYLTQSGSATKFLVEGLNSKESYKFQFVCTVESANTTASTILFDASYFPTQGKSIVHKAWKQSNPIMQLPSDNWSDCLLDATQSFTNEMRAKPLEITQLEDQTGTTELSEEDPRFSVKQPPATR